MPGIKILVRTKGPVLDSVEMTSRGPVFDGTARATIKKQMRATKDALGAELVHQVQIRTDKFFVNPTGYYRSQIDYLINQGNGAVIIHDRGVVYGPWLELGRTTTRFRGYHIFRQVTQQTQAQVDQVAAKEISVMVKQLNP